MGRDLEFDVGREPHEVYTDYDVNRHFFKMLLDGVEERYTCLRPPRASGALLVAKLSQNSMTTILGDVAPAYGSPTCEEIEECLIEYSGDGPHMTNPHCVRTIHAEVKAILRAARHGIMTDQAVMYSVNKPCFNCTKVIIEAGISRVFYLHAVYDEKRTQDIIAASGLSVIPFLYMPDEEQEDGNVH